MKKAITRRKMLRLTAMAGAATMIPSYLKSSPPVGERVNEKEEIPLRTLGRTGMQLPILSMGCNRSDNSNILRAAYNGGIFHFDCGHIYQNGKSEEIIGNILGGKPRNKINIATKAMFDYPLRDNFEEVLFEQLDLSLKRMRIEYVDIFYAHSVSSVEKLTDPRVLAALQKIKTQGKARFIGFSSHDQNNDLLRAAITAGIYDVAMITYNFRIDHLQETEAVIEQAVEAGMGIIAMKVMAGGSEDLEGKKKINGKACLKWVWQNKNITTVLPSIANYDELDSCFEAVQELKLTAEEEQYLSFHSGKQNIFCRQCGECRGECPQGLPVPDLMRAYMYAYGYKNAKLSKETLMLSGISKDVCKDCDKCKVRCAAGFRVGEKIAAIRGLIEVPDVFLT